MAGRSFAAAMVFFGAAAAGSLAGTSPAGADQASVRQQIDALETQVQSGAAQIHTLTVEFDQAEVQSATLAQQVQSDRSEMSRVESRAAASQSDVEQQALLAYTGGALAPAGLPASGSGLPATGEADPSVQAEYLEVAAGDVSDAVDQYHVDEEQLAAVTASLERQEQASAAAAASAAQARQADMAQATSEQAELGQLQSQLSQLVEAAAAVASQPPTPSAQGLPVNGGVVSVVQSIVAPPSQSGGAGGVWLELRECESSDNYQENSGNGYYGAYQFSQQTWSGLGYPGRPDLEPPSMQDQAAMQLQAQAGWGQWPACAAALGLT